MATVDTQSGNNPVQSDDKALQFQADGQDKIDLPSTALIADAQIVRDGNDLLLEAPNGQTAVIEGYFSADPAPTLISPDGSALTPNLVQAFARSPSEFAARETATDESPVGAVEEVKGTATVTHADGTTETLSNGSPIYQGDIIQTDVNGAVNIVFIDETSMAVSENARLAIDEYTYDPSTESGTTNFSVLRGVFVFTSGLIGRDDPDDVKIDTPVGSIGIRGTIIAGEINPGGVSNISVLEGAIVVKNGLGETTLSEQFETVRLGGFDHPMKDIGVLSASEIGSRFSSISSVNASLFTMIDDAAKEQAAQPGQESPVQNAPDSPTTEQNNEPQSSNQPDALQSFDGAPASLSGANTGLPPSSTVSGQPDSGFTGSQPSVTTSSAGTTTSAVAPAPVNHNETSGTQTSQATQQPPPSVIEQSAGNSANGTTTPTTPSAIPLTVGLSYLTDIMQAGTVLGHINNTAGSSSITYNFASGTNTQGYYAFLTNGTGVDIVLTTAGAQALRDSLTTVQLGNFSVVATDTVTGVTGTQAVTVNIHDASAGDLINLDFTSIGSVSVISDTINNNFGYSISAVGDINGDGFDDFIVGNDSSATGNNHSYLVYGSASGVPTSLVTGPYVTTTSGYFSGNYYGESIVAGIGDFDGDGIQDFVVGHWGASVNGFQSGNAAIVSGATAATGDNVQFVNGTNADKQIGYSVTGAGDFNNDGYADVVIGAPGADGQIYLVFGGNDPWSDDLDNTNYLNNPNANEISNAAGVGFGASVAGIGDFNGDGYSDYAVGAPGGDFVKVFWGSSVTTSTSSSTITGVTGTNFGQEIGYLGDINGDGKSDMMIADEEGKAFILYGGSTPSIGETLQINNYEITGGGGIGDFNGDGFDDFAISLSNGTTTNAYVVFGKDGGLNIGSDLSTYLKDPANALELTYSSAGENDDLEFSRVGDINGDGYDDFAIGVPDANQASTGNGGIILVYGREHNETNTVMGTSGNDTLNDDGASAFGQSLRGGAGNDVIGVHNTDFLGVDGGSNTLTGHDTLLALGDLDFTNVGYEKISGIEQLEFSGSGQTMTLTMENIFNLLKTSDNGSLTIENGSGAGNILNFDVATPTGTATNDKITNGLNEVGTGAAEVASDKAGYNEFTIGGYKLYIDQDVTVNVQ
ncbi:MAG: hypothetical protein DI551_00945 [Micavibrio aeruginosavorus]|uniref:FecR protein domain-containing protein n=1 Tax=Micavibrio aeruginosavorus TaxID=349221 RepID=A0A2W5N5A4_9BACT|nr:MAG: hypothetical protein DI551_00945 [Micavibrio aeruginosavorus]